MSERIIKLPIYGIVITLVDRKSDSHRGWVGGSISTSLHEPCPACGEVSCYAHCDKSTETEDEYDARATFNKMISAMESFILAQACAGVDVESPAYLEALKTGFDAIGNNY